MTLSKGLSPLLKKLTGGDRRQIGRSNAVAAAVLKKPSLFADLFSGLTASDPLVRMRAADAAEKVTRQKPDLLTPHKAALLRVLENTEEQEVAWHVAVMAPRLTLNAKDRNRVRTALETYLDAPSRIQRVMALQGLADLALQDSSLIPGVIRLINKALESEGPSMRSRARKLKTALEQATR